jgi:hypothetical protein
MFNDRDGGTKQVVWVGSMDIISILDRNGFAIFLQPHTKQNLARMLFPLDVKIVDPLISLVDIQDSR